MKSFSSTQSEYLELLVHSAPRGYIIVDKSETIQVVNELFKQAFGKDSKKDFSGKHPEKLFGAQYWNEVLPFYKKALRGITTQEATIKTSYLKNKGLPIYHVATYFPLHKNKRVVAVGIILRDATSQKLVEVNLEKYKERLEQAQKAGNIGVFDWDLTTDSVWWSPEEEPLFGVTPGKFSGNIDDWFGTIFKEDVAHVKKAIKKAISDKKDLDVEFRVSYPGNITHWLRSKGHIYYNDGIAERMIGVHYDVSVRKRNIALLTYKAEASRILSSHIDYEESLKQIASLATHYIADWCVIEMLDEETGELFPLSISHKNPQKVSWAYTLRAQRPVHISQETGTTKVIKSGEPLFIPFISQTELRAAGKTRKEKTLIQKLQLTSAMILPLTVSQKTIGTLSFIMADSKRQYTEEDFEVAKQLASRASLAIENANLYETVKTERERLDDLLANVPGVVWESWGDPTTNAQKITYVSAHAERLLGYPREDWLTKPNFWHTIIHPEDKELAAKTAKANFEAGGTGVSRFRWLTKDGRAIWMESQSYVVKSKRGKSLGMRGVVVDITDAMEQVSRKDEFLSLASHELKTPVTTIKAFTQLLASKVEDKTAKEYLSKMEIQINKQMRLVSELLDVSKIQKGKLELHKEVFPIDIFLKDTIQELQAVSKTHKIKTNLRAKADIHADCDRLAQVISNLVNNAIKYSPDAVSILVTSRDTKSEVIITIKDFGVGVAPVHQDKIFSRFYRVKNATQAPGLGIGLFISKEIVTRHEGTLEVKSIPGKGSTFIITLPII